MFVWISSRAKVIVQVCSSLLLVKITKIHPALLKGTTINIDVSANMCLVRRNGEVGEIDSTAREGTNTGWRTKVHAKVRFECLLGITLEVLPAPLEGTVMTAHTEVISEVLPELLIIKVKEFFPATLDGTGIERTVRSKVCVQVRHESLQGPASDYIVATLKGTFQVIFAFVDDVFQQVI